MRRMAVVVFVMTTAFGSESARSQTMTRGFYAAAGAGPAGQQSNEHGTLAYSGLALQASAGWVLATHAAVEAQYTDMQFSGTSFGCPSGAPCPIDPGGRPEPSGRHPNSAARSLTGNLVVGPGADQRGFFVLTGAGFRAMTGDPATDPAHTLVAQLGGGFNVRFGARYGIRLATAYQRTVNAAVAERWTMPFTLGIRL